MQNKTFKPPILKALHRCYNDLIYYILPFYAVKKDTATAESCILSQLEK